MQALLSFIVCSTAASANQSSRWIVVKEITIGDIAQTLSLPVAVLLAFWPIYIAAKEHLWRKHVDELLRLLDLYGQESAWIYQKLTTHQMGKPCYGGDLRSSREFLSLRQKDMQVVESQVLSFLSAKQNESFRLASRDWWKDMTEWGIVSEVSEVWKSDDTRLTEVRRAQQKFTEKLTELRKCYIHSRRNIWDIMFGRSGSV